MYCVLCMFQILSAGTRHVVERHVRALVRSEPVCLLSVSKKDNTTVLYITSITIPFMSSASSGHFYHIKL